MKQRIQVTLAALLLVALAAGCGGPRCTSSDGRHAYGKWEHHPANAWYKLAYNARTCETCGWTERITE